MFKNKTKIKILESGFLSNLRIIIFCLSIVSILAYLMVVNDANTKGIVAAEMQLQISDLKNKYRDLSNQATQLQSMTRIEEISNMELSMVSAETYDYVLAKEDTVAFSE